MLNIYLDTNVHSQLSNGLYPEKLVEINTLKLEGKITVYFTGDNLLELICMVQSEESFIKCRDILRSSSGLCSKHTLEDNWGHMQRPVADFLGVRPPDLRFDWVRTAYFISNAKSYEEVKKDKGFLQVRNNIPEFKQRWHTGACDTRKRIKELFNLQKRPSPEDPRVTLLSEDWVHDMTRRELWEACKVHHRLPDYADTLHYLTAYKKIPTVRYFIDLQRVYYDRMLKEDTKPKESGYFDLEYVIYLDLMDYFVTNDNGLHNLYSYASREICQGCILLKDVCKLELLAPRAPFRDRVGKTRYEIRKK